MFQSRPERTAIPPYLLFTPNIGHLKLDSSNCVGGEGGAVMPQLWRETLICIRVLCLISHYLPKKKKRKKTAAPAPFVRARYPDQSIAF